MIHASYDDEVNFHAYIYQHCSCLGQAYIKLQIQKTCLTIYENW